MERRAAKLSSKWPMAGKPWATCLKASSSLVTALSRSPISMFSCGIGCTQAWLMLWRKRQAGFTERDSSSATTAIGLMT